MKKALLLFCCLLAAGCPQSPEESNKQPANSQQKTQSSSQVDSTGGTVSFENATLDIGPGAVSQDVTITVKKQTTNTSEIK